MWLLPSTQSASTFPLQLLPCVSFSVDMCDKALRNNERTEIWLRLRLEISFYMGHLMQVFLVYQICRAFLTWFDLNQACPLANISDIQLLLPSKNLCNFYPTTARKLFQLLLLDHPFHLCNFCPLTCISI